MASQKSVLVYITAPDLRCARRLAEAIVGARLAACVNLLPGMQSIYRWKGRVERAKEVVLIAKSTARRFPLLVSEVRKLHPYECPCVVALPLTRGFAPYLQWIDRETRDGAATPPRRN